MLWYKEKCIIDVFNYILSLHVKGPNIVYSYVFRYMVTRQRITFVNVYVNGYIDVSRWPFRIMSKTNQTRLVTID